MNTVQEVLTLEEVSGYLRLPTELVERQAKQGQIPGRQIEQDWRFLRPAIDDWLRNAERWPGIEKTPGVVGGDACIVRTRIPVWTLEGYRQLGWSDEQILESFPTLRSFDLIQAWRYVATHREEIETALRENEEA